MTKVLSHLLSISQHKCLLIVIIFSFIFFVTPRVRSTAELQDGMTPFGIRGGKSFKKCYYWASSTGIGSLGNEIDKSCDNRTVNCTIVESFVTPLVYPAA